MAATPLSLQEAFAKALVTHPLIQRSQGLLSASQDEVDSAKWKRYPTLSTEFSSRVGTAQTNDPYQNQNRGSTWRVQQPLWAGGRIDAEIDAAKQKEKVASFAQEESEQDVLLKAAQGFFDVQRFTLREAITRENFDEHKKQFDMISRRADQEINSQADVSLAKARLQQVQAEWFAAQSALRTAKQQLAQMLDDKLADGIAPPNQVPIAWESFDAAFLEATGAAPNLRRITEEIELANADARVKSAGMLPQLALRYEKFDGLAAVLPYDRVMVVLEYQPGAGLGAYSAATAAQKRADASRFDLINGRRDLHDRLAREYNDARANADQLGPSAAFLEAAQSVRDSYTRQFVAGRKSWLEVLNSLREWSQARLNHADISVAAGLSATRLNILAGRIHRTTILLNEQK